MKTRYAALSKIFLVVLAYDIQTGAKEMAIAHNLQKHENLNCIA